MKRFLEKACPSGEGRRVVRYLRRPVWTEVWLVNQFAALAMDLTSGKDTCSAWSEG